MNAHSTHRSLIWLSLMIVLLLSATAVFADGPGGNPPKRPYRPEPVPTRSPVPPPSPEVTKDPPRPDPPIGPVTTPTQTPSPPQPPLDRFWWWISAAILLLLLLLLLAWILRRRTSTGYVTPPSNPTEPAYPPVDQSRQQTRPDQY